MNRDLTTPITKPYNYTANRALMSGPDECFSASSLISLANGIYKPVEDIIISDYLNNFSGDSIILPNGDIGKIIGIHYSENTKNTNIFKVYAETPGIGETSIVVCAGHMLITEDMHSIPATFLQLGDKILGERGPAKVTKIEKYNEAAGEMVNLSIASEDFLIDLAKKVTSGSIKNLSDWLKNAFWHTNFGIGYNNHIIYLNGLAVADQQHYSEYYRRTRSTTIPQQ